MTVQKHQYIRLLDVFFIGPLMIYAASAKAPSASVKNMLLLLGVATIVYNGRNYLLEQSLTNETR